MKRILKILGVIFVLPPLLYLVLAIIGALIPVNTDYRPENPEIEIYLQQSGVHTDIVVPFKNEFKNWGETVSQKHSLSSISEANFIKFGWGDLEFFRKTPHWEDLTLKTGFRALFMKTPAALHLEFSEEIPITDKSISLKIDPVQYKKLIQYLEKSFLLNEDGKVQPVKDLHYNQNDAFYLANGSLNLFNTCNTWANKALKASEVKTCLWTPFPQGIFYRY